MAQLNSKDLVWVKPHPCAGNGDCVEIANTGDGVAVRDSKNPKGAMLQFTKSEMKAFADAIRGGEFDSMIQ